MNNKTKLKKLDVFARIEADVDRGMKVSKDWDEQACYQQELLNQIDIDEQKRCGGIKPMKDQFPGEGSDINCKLDVLESDKIQRKNQLASECIEKRLSSGKPEIITKPEGTKVIAFIEYPDGRRVAVAGGKAFPDTGAARAAAQKQIESSSPKKLSSGSKHTATIAVLHESAILMGQRRDNGKWTFPGGGLNAGEDAHAGAVRELYEEAGVRAKRLEHIGSKEVSGRTGNKINVHCFRLELPQRVQTTSFNDPDNEVAKWQWIECSKGLPPEIMMELQSPKNLLLQHLGLQ